MVNKTTQQKNKIVISNKLQRQFKGNIKYKHK